MRVRVQVVIESEDNGPPVVHEVAQLDRGDLLIDTLGLQLAEAKDLLQKVQEVVVSEQVRTCLAEQVACPQCGRARRHKDADVIVVRTLFGTLHLRSPRWWHCRCQPQPTHTFCPLAAALPERTTPELLYLESKFSGWCPMDSARGSSLKPYRLAGRYTRPRCDSMPRRPPRDWRTSLAPSNRCSSRAVSATGMSCRGLTCH